MRLKDMHVKFDISYHGAGRIYRISQDEASKLPLDSEGFPFIPLSPTEGFKLTKEPEDTFFLDKRYEDMIWLPQ
jgi:hypothetical protein